MPEHLLDPAAWERLIEAGDVLVGFSLEGVEVDPHRRFSGGGARNTEEPGRGAGD